MKNSIQIGYKKSPTKVGDFLIIKLLLNEVFLVVLYERNI